MNEIRNKTRFLVYNALFIALILVMQLTGIGIIRMGVINITFFCTVIAAGTLVLGLASGLVQGAAFAIISFIMALTGPSGLVAPILANSWLQVFIMCFVPRLLVPVAVHSLYRLTMKVWKKDKLSLALAGAAGSAVNSIFYLGIMLLCYIPMLSEHPGVVATVGGILLSASIPECVAAAVIAPAVVLALRKIKN